MKHSNKALILALASAFTLSACGGGGGSSPATAATNTNQAAADKAAADKAAADKAAADKAAADKAAADKAAADKAAADKAAADKAAADKAAEDAARKAAEDAKKTTAPAGLTPEAVNAEIGKLFAADANGMLVSAGKLEKQDGFGTTLEERFTAHVLTLDTQAQTARAQAIADNAEGKDHKTFVLNGTKIVLLSSGSDKLKGEVALRPFEARDFYQPAPADSTDTPVAKPEAFNAANPGWVGSLLASPYGTETGLGAYDSLRYGVYNDPEGKSHLFVFGAPASQSRINAWVANQNVFNYTGSVIAGKDGQYQGYANALTATADFGKQQVELTANVGDTLKFGGAIKGNGFEGTQNGIYTKGGFFGNYNLGGHFNVIEGKNQGLNGVYGGSRQ